MSAQTSRRLETLARESERSRADVIRQFIDNGHVSPVRVPRVNLEVAGDLRKTGVLLNQIARHLNMGHAIDVERLRGTCRELALLLTDLTE